MEKLYFYKLTLSIIVVKIIGLLIDPNIMFFMGDSGSYIHTALTGWAPPDRSFIYGIGLMPFIKISNSLYSIVLLQTIAGFLSALLLATIIIRYFKGKKSVAFLTALIFSFEPFQITYERYVLTESFSTLFFIAYTVCLLELLKTRHTYKFLMLAVTASAACLLLRTAFYPVLLVGLAIVLSLKIIENLKEEKFLTQKYAFKTVGVIILFIGFIGLLTLLKAPQSRHDGYFWLAMTSPLVQPNYFSNYGIPTSIYENSKCEKTLESREQQRWLKGCMVDLTYKHYGEHDKAVEASKSIAKQAILESPVKFTLLGIKTYIRFWDEEVIKKSIRRDLGIGRKLSDEFQERLKTNFNLSYDRFHTLKTVTRTYLQHSIFWVKILLGTPILLFIIFLVTMRSNLNRATLVLTILSAAYMATICLFITDNVVRYLHPMPFFFFIAMAMLTNLKKIAHKASPE